MWLIIKCRIFTGYQPPLPLWFLHRWCVAYIVQHVYTNHDMVILYVVPMAYCCGMVVLTHVFGMSVVVRICTKGLRLCAIYGLLSILMPGPVIDCARGLAGWFGFSFSLSMFEHSVCWLHDEYISWAPMFQAMLATPAWTWQPACFVGTIINLSVAAVGSLELMHNWHTTYSLGKQYNS